MSEEVAGEIDTEISPLGKFFENLDLLAPGDNTLTKDAFHRILPLPSKPKILDIGCGTGRSTLVLAEASPEASIEAIDAHQPFLDKCDAAAKERGFKIETRCLSMDRLADELEDDTYDLIWSEGAAYHVGFENALRTWRDLLKPDGAMVVSELCWLSDDPPKEAETFWVEAYPQMVTVDETIARAKSAGFNVFDTITMPEEAWDAYYGPLEARCTELEATADQRTAAYIHATRKELSIFKRFRGSYGYVMFLMRRK